MKDILNKKTPQQEEKPQEEKKAKTTVGITKKVSTRINRDGEVVSEKVQEGNF